MLKFLFLGMFKRTCDSYGDCLMQDLGLAPIVLASPQVMSSSSALDNYDEDSWAREFDR